MCPTRSKKLSGDSLILRLKVTEILKVWKYSKNGRFPPGNGRCRTKALFSKLSIYQHHATGPAVIASTYLTSNFFQSTNLTRMVSSVTLLKLLTTATGAWVISSRFCIGMLQPLLILGSHYSHDLRR